MVRSNLVAKIKKGKRWEEKILIFAIFLLVVINYNFIDGQFKNLIGGSQEAFAERVIDGDTIDIGNESVRLLGINTPEKGDFFYNEAKIFLESMVLEKNVTLEFVGPRYDKYDRLLAYVFSDSKNVNVEMVENGFANYYFYEGKDMYSGDLVIAWNQCMQNKINLCEPSENSCASCIYLNSNSITNFCSESCNVSGWQVRGEGREKFVFVEQSIAPGEEAMFVLNLENSGGSVFLRDEEGKLVYWQSP